MWLQARGVNTKFFHRYANIRENINSVWKIDKGNNNWATIFKDFTKEGVNYFSNLFREDSQANFVEFIKLSNSFPSFSNHKDNLKMLKEVGKEELQWKLQSFQRDKSLGLDGLPVELILKCYEFIKHDPGRVVEATRTTGKMLDAFNTNFIALIHKEDNLTCFEKNRSISLCNCIYKIISKVISKRLKRVLSKQNYG